MACLHKFHEYLNLANLDFEPTTLIVGTFNPSWPAGNNAEWFYGRVRNNYFWDVLPRLYNPELNLRKLKAKDWKIFCSENRIALTDIISSIDDAKENTPEHHDILRTYVDASIADYFADFTFTNISTILAEKPTIKYVYLTRQEGIPLFDLQWTLVEQYRIENPERNLRIKYLITPSGSARFQIGPYKQANPNDPTPLRNFIFFNWKQQWHKI